MNKVLSAWRIVLVAFLFVLCANSCAVSASEMPRYVLALYDSSEEYNRYEDNNLIHNNAEMVLNHLGVKVRYHDIAIGLPEPEDLKDTLGVLSWFRDDEISHAQEYCRWAIEVLKAGKKFVILKNIGGFKDRETKNDTDFELVQQFYAALGLEYRGEWTDNPMLVELKFKEPGMVEFERTLQDEIEAYEGIKSANPQNHVYLALNRKDVVDGESAIVVTTPFGGLAVEDYGFYLNYYDDSRRWRLDPFRFFEEAFGLKGIPRMDTTTLLGRRIFYSHIDGDGFRNLSEVDPKKYSSEIIRDEILKKYPLPFTVSVIQAEVDLNYFGTKRSLKVAREIFALPNVEPSSHTFSHPLDWEKQLVAFVIPGYSRPQSGFDTTQYPRDNIYPSAARVILPAADYLQRETIGSVEYINRELCPVGKKVKVLQWTGNCKPQSEAIALARGIGLEDINGGDSRFDRKSPTYSTVTPLTRQSRGVYQAYTSAPNENIYTDGWRKDYHAFRYVLETFQQTESPTLINAPGRRVAPVNVYYHFYTGEKALALQSLQQVYDDVLQQELIPLFTSEYLKIVDGFHSAKIEALADGGWRVRDYGDDRTVRFDHEDRFPDIKRCRGVIGFNKVAGSLYVALSSGEEAVIYLTAESPSQPYLKESANVISDWSSAERGFEFRSRGFKDAYFVFAGMNEGTIYKWEIAAEENLATAFSGEATVDSRGELILNFPMQGWNKVSLRQRE